MMRKGYKIGVADIIRSACESRSVDLAKWKIKLLPIEEFRVMTFRAITNSCPQIVVLLRRECLRRLGTKKDKAPELLGIGGFTHSATWPGVSPRTFSLTYRWLNDDEHIICSNALMLNAVNFKNIKVMKLLKRYMVRSSLKIAFGSMTDYAMEPKHSSKNRKIILRMIRKWSKELANFEFNIGFMSNQNLH